MSETTTATPQEQSKTENATVSGFDRLSADPQFLLDDYSPKTETTPEKTATEETAELEGEKKENATTETKAETTTEETKTEEVKEEAKEEEGFSDDTTTATPESEGTWKSYLESNGYEVPADFTEEKGLEVLLEAERNKIKAEYEPKIEVARETIFEELPEETRSEARMIFELMSQGQTLDQINAPIETIKAFRAMEPEQLIRKNLELQGIYSEEEINYKMEKISADGKVDIEHKILLNEVNATEKQVIAQREQQIEAFKARQTQIRESKRQQEISSFKAALDRVPSFMDRKLSDENKRAILNEYSTGAAEQLMKNPEKVAKFLLWEKYGEQGMKYIQARAQEKALLEHKKNLHNVPENVIKTGNGTTTTNDNKQHASGMDRLQEDPNFK